MRPTSLAAAFGILLTLAWAGPTAADPGGELTAAAAGLTSERALYLELNRVRSSFGLPLLATDARLLRAARAHTRTMLRRNAFGHGDTAGRLRRFGVRGFVGENLAWGAGSSSSAQAIVAMWLASAPHRANLLRVGFRRVGVGASVGAFGGHEGATVVTVDFAGS